MSEPLATAARGVKKALSTHGGIYQRRDPIVGYSRPSQARTPTAQQATNFPANGAFRTGDPISKCRCCDFPQAVNQPHPQARLPRMTSIKTGGDLRLAPRGSPHDQGERGCRRQVPPTQPPTSESGWLWGIPFSARVGNTCRRLWCGWEGASVFPRHRSPGCLTAGTKVEGSTETLICGQGLSIRFLFPSQQTPIHTVLSWSESFTDHEYSTLHNATRNTRIRSESFNIPSFIYLD